MKGARITVSRGETINLGNYEFARLDFSVEIDVKEGETIGQTFEFAYRVVSEQLDRRRAELLD